MATETQTSYAKSQYSDPVNILNFIAIALTLPAVHVMIAPRFEPLIDAIVALSNIALRTLFVTHPVTNIAPGQIRPIEVKKLEATKPGTEDPAKLPDAIQPKP